MTHPLVNTILDLRHLRTLLQRLCLLCYHFTSRPIFTELTDVLVRPKFGIDSELVERVLRKFEDISEIVTIN